MIYPVKLLLMFIHKYLSLLVAISFLNGIFWFGVGRWATTVHYEASCKVHVPEALDGSCTHYSSCRTKISYDIPSVRPILTKGLMKYKESSLVKVPYPDWSLLIQPNHSTRCDIVVNPHVSRKRQHLCLAVVTAKSDSTYNLLRIESDPENPAPPDAPVLNITGFFNNVANDQGRKKLADKMGKLLLNLDSLESYVINRLLARGLQPGSDVVVMVVNAGEMDLLANFACSCQAHNISMRNMMVFSGSDDVLPLIESFGAMGFYHQPTFADVSRNASYEYLDRIFIDMMWYKSFSVWLLLKLQYNVLFQDVDLVWYRDPVHYFRTASELPVTDDVDSRQTAQTLRLSAVTAMKENLLSLAQNGAKSLPIFGNAPPGSGHHPHAQHHHSKNVLTTVEADSWGHSLNALPQADAYLSDDGQRSLRYTPFFANSGFYYLVANPRTEYFAWTIMTAFDLLHITGSHQNIFTIRLIESLDLANIRPKLLSLREFPSGVKFNHDKPYMRAIRDQHEHPFVFHM